VPGFARTGRLAGRGCVLHQLEVGVYDLRAVGVGDAGGGTVDLLVLAGEVAGGRGDGGDAEGGAVPDEAVVGAFELPAQRERDPFTTVRVDDRTAATLALRAAGVALPPTIRDAAVS